LSCIFCKNIKYFLSVLLLSGLVWCAGGQEPIAARLMRQGFPADYAVKLAILQKKHPNWRFHALPVTELEKKYTWQYVLYMETDHAPSRSLISGKSTFSAYFHPVDDKIYDANCRRASREATAYFLDPRNFLNEQDIFQFLDLRRSEPVAESAVKIALRGTFMEHETLENGYSYAQYLCELGRIFKIDPIFLASRVRQEQGINGTMLISGRCGSWLASAFWKSQFGEKNARITIKAPEMLFLHKYDGLFNFFNIEASGNGRFIIYLNGMREAWRGSPSMSKNWNGSAWNTKWKALYGGTEKIVRNYIDNYQNTAYLQKWNVDPRSRSEKGNSRNFWGQYMQNIGAAFSEGRNSYQTFKRQNMLDLPFNFLIPVYKNMPEKVSPDPAGGKCVYYRNGK